MSDLLDEFNKIFIKDLLPTLGKYIKDPNNKISDKFNNFVNNPQSFLVGILEKVSKNKEVDFNKNNYNDLGSIVNIDPILDDEYEELLQRLVIIEENMIHIQNLLKDKN